jgi:four helix bundle protein
MSGLQHARSFRELSVYQKCRQLASKIFQMSQSFPREERYSLTDQIRRSSRAIGANLAEAWAKRRYEKHFVSKLTDADGEQMETQHWIETARDSRYIDEPTCTQLIVECQEIGRMLNGMMEKAAIFCGRPPRTIREWQADYFAGIVPSPSQHDILPTDY